jgi:hypothetical protein
MITRQHVQELGQAYLRLEAAKKRLQEVGEFKQPHRATLAIQGYGLDNHSTTLSIEMDRKVALGFIRKHAEDAVKAAERQVRALGGVIE